MLQAKILQHIFLVAAITFRRIDKRFKNNATEAIQHHEKMPELQTLQKHQSLRSKSRKKRQFICQFVQHRGWQKICMISATAIITRRQWQS
jgi:hypothetical protein